VFWRYAQSFASRLDSRNYAVVKGGLREKMKGKGKVSIAPRAGTAILFAPVVILLFAVTPVIAQPVEVKVNATAYVAEGETFSVTIDITGVTDLNTAQFALSFDPDIVNLRNVGQGEIKKEKFPTFMHYPSAEGILEVLMSMPIGEGISGSGHLAEIEFVAKGEEGDEIVLDLSEGALIDKEGQERTLFYLNEKFKDELNDGEISDDLKGKFEAEGHPLENPTVNVIKKDEIWDITDEREVYTVIFDAEASALEIGDTGRIPANWYGAAIRIGAEEEEDDNDLKEDGEVVTPGYPNITAWKPTETVVRNAASESRTFNISVSQIADIRWQINGTEVQTNGSVAEAVYTNTSAVIGTWNVSAIATNTTTGLSDMHTWLWSVTLTATVTPTPMPTVTPTPTPAPEAETKGTPMPTPTPTPGVTPTPEPPGFGAILAIAVMLAVAYILLRRR
jgi:hypothetical protein